MNRRTPPHHFTLLQKGQASFCTHFRNIKVIRYTQNIYVRVHTYNLRMFRALEEKGTYIYIYPQLLRHQLYSSEITDRIQLMYLITYYIPYIFQQISLSVCGINCMNNSPKIRNDSAKEPSFHPTVSSVKMTNDIRKVT